MATISYNDANDNGINKTIIVDSNNAYAWLQAIRDAGGDIVGEIFTNGRPTIEMWAEELDEIIEAEDLSETVQIRSAAEAMTLQDLSLNRSYLVISQEFGDSGAQRAQQYTLTAREDVSIQPLSDINSSSRSFSFTLSVTENRFIYEVISEAAETTSDVEVVVRKDNADGPVINVMSNISVVADTEMRVPLDDGPQRLTQGEVLYFTVSGAIFKGSMIDSQFIPTFSINNQIWSNEDISSDQDIVDAEKTNATTIQFTRRNGSTFDLSVGGGTSFDRPRITSLSIAGQDLTPDAGTTISGDLTFNYAVSNTSNVQGDLTLTQDGADLSTTVSAAGSSVVVTANSITLAAGESTTFVLSLTDTQGGTDTRQVAIRVSQPQELIYFGVQASSDATLYDINTGSSTEFVPDIQSITAPTFSGSQHLVIAQLASEHDLTMITISGINQINAFTKTDNAFMVNSQQYDAWVSDNQLIGSIISGINILLER